MKFSVNPLLRYLRWGAVGIFVILPIYLSAEILLPYFGIPTGLLVAEKDFLPWLITCPVLVGGCGFVMLYWLWEKCFATLEITEQSIIWRCPFRRKRVMEISDCRDIRVVLENSRNGLEYPHICFSDCDYRKEYPRQFHKLKGKNGLITFWYSEELCRYLVAHLPSPLTGSLSAYRIRSKRK